MSPKVEEVTNIKFTGDEYTFSYTGNITIFDGYSKVYKADEEEQSKYIPSLKENEKIICKEVTKEQHFTKGPNRFNEAKVVKTMEDLGIGRPSTYASTISTLYARDYIKNEKGSLFPTEQGTITVDNLTKFFEPFMETSYTAQMERELDEISYQDGTRNKILSEFYKEFETLFETAQSNMKKEQPKLTGELCPQCGKPLVYRKSKFGQFEACSGYPECNYVKKPEKIEPIYSDKVCPQCGKPLVLRKSKKGEFFACSGFPKCHYIEGDEEQSKSEQTNLVCPKCGKPLLKKAGKNGRNDFYACSGFPRCRYIQSIK